MDIKKSKGEQRVLVQEKKLKIKTALIRLM